MLDLAELPKPWGKSNLCTDSCLIRDRLPPVVQDCADTLATSCSLCRAPHLLTFLLILFNNLKALPGALSAEYLAIAFSLQSLILL